MCLVGKEISSLECEGDAQPIDARAPLCERNFGTNMASFFELLLAGSAGLRGRCGWRKRRGVGKLADASAGGVGFDGEQQTNVSFPWNLVIKHETVNKLGTSCWRKRKIDWGTRGPTSKFSGTRIGRPMS